MQRVSVFDKDLFLNVPVLSMPDGKLCPYVIVEGKFSKLVTAYHSIQSDLLETQAMINYLKANSVLPGVVKAAMFKAIITQYSKCFTKAWGRAAKLEAKSVFDSKEDLMVIHKEVRDIRNNYITHAGTGRYDNGAMIIYLDPNLDNPAIGRIINSDFKFMDHSLKLSGYDRICQAALQYVEFKIEKLSVSYDKEVDALDLKDLYKKVKIPNRKDLSFTKDDANMRNTRGPHYLRD